MDGRTSSKIRPRTGARSLFDPNSPPSRIGQGELGGKAQGLVLIRESLQTELDPAAFPEIKIEIPVMAVLCTDVFTAFMETQSPIRNWLLQPARRAHRPRLPESGPAHRRPRRPADAGQRGAHPAGSPLVQPAGRRGARAVCRRLCHQDDPEQPVRPGYSFPPADRSHQVRVCIHLFQSSQRLPPGNRARRRKTRRWR